MTRFVLVLLCLLPMMSMAAELPQGIIKITPRPAPALQLTDLDGEAYSLAARGKRWAFVHFWASWCGPCRREIPAIGQLMVSFENAPLDFAIVNTAESEDVVFSFLGGVAPDLVPLMDRDGQVTEAWQPRGLPSTYLVDPHGMIQYVVIGGQPWHTPAYKDFLRRLSDGAGE